jgi:hypothetical protein
MKFFDNLGVLISNPHIRWPVVIGVVLALVPVWFPQWADKCNASIRILIAYGLAAAANSAPTSKP